MIEPTQAAMNEPNLERGTRQFATENEPELKRVIGDLWQHSETLVRQEVELFKAESEARMVHAKAAAVRAAISGGLFHAAYLTLLATVVLVFAQWLEPWLASLIVSIAASAGAGIFAYLGKEEAEEATERPHTKRPSRPLGHQRAHT